MHPNSKLNQDGELNDPVSADEISSDALMAHVLKVYAAADGQPLDNNVLYARVAESAQLPLDLFEQRVPVGRDGALFNVFKRKIRWHQQTLRQSNIISRIEGKRGVWGLATPFGKEDAGLSTLPQDTAVLGFSTALGFAIIGASEHVFAQLPNEPLLGAVITSPPYPLKQARAYGNVSEQAYVDWLCKVLEPAIARMTDGGSLLLNLSNDVFASGSPARSTYLERLTLALVDRFGLSLMDRQIWDNPSKPPGPVAWASKSRVQLNVGYEPLYWFTNNPSKVTSNNQRVLQPHSPRQAKLIAAGGVKVAAEKSDGAYRIRPGSYGNPTAGRIPKNVLRFGSASKENREYLAAAKAAGLRPHGAMMPYALVRFLVEFLTEVGQVVADPFAGSLTTGQACEDTSRFWLCVERMVQYVAGGMHRFKSKPGFVRAPVWGSEAFG